MTTQSQVQARASIVAEFTTALEGKREELRDAPDNQYVIYTGEHRVWVNIKAAREGRMCISIEHASHYLSYGRACVDAALVKNGRGERGQVCTVKEAYEWEIKNLEEAIASLRKEH